MTDVLELLKNVLKKNGYSLTKPRKIIFDALENQEPQTIHDLVVKLKDKIDRASVYRTVALFEELGIVQRLQIGWKYKLELSDLFHHHHHHISCMSCGTIVPLRENDILEIALNSLAKEYGFEPRTHQLEIQGLCATCQREQ